MPVKSRILDVNGSPITKPVRRKTTVNPKVKKQAMGLYGNIYSYPNYGQYRPRFYSLQDAEQGLDNLSRELLVRWSRECVAQLPFIDSAIRILAQFSVGNAYLPEYNGNNSAWGKEATQWLREVFYPNCCTRGSAFDFQNVMFLASCVLDQDGDFLCVYGRDSTGFPKIQIIPSHRIRSATLDGLGQATGITGWAPGPFKDTLVADGVVYGYDGSPVGFNVVNYGNLVNSLAKTTEDVFVSIKDAHLVFDARYFDKGRGRPSIGSAILQALSIQEIDTYLLDKVKLSSMLGYVETTPSGEAPIEFETTQNLLNAEAASFGVFNPAPNTHAVEIVQGVTNRYIKAEGGDIKMLDSNTPSNETKDYITRLETQILSTIGVPHSLVFSQEVVSGRVSDGVGEISNSAIDRRQKILDKHGKFIIAFALANAMKEKLIPENNDENLYTVFNLTHPPKFSLNAGYDRQSDLADYNAGITTLDDIAKKSGKTSSDILEQKEKESIEFFTRANK